MGLSDIEDEPRSYRYIQHTAKISVCPLVLKSFPVPTQSCSYWTYHMSRVPQSLQQGYRYEKSCCKDTQPTDFENC